jgi:hypothetical protein
MDSADSFDSPLANCCNQHNESIGPIKCGLNVCPAVLCRAVLQCVCCPVLEVRILGMRKIGLYIGLFYMCLLVYYMFKLGDRGGTVVKALCYKSEGRWFDSR